MTPFIVMSIIAVFCIITSWVVLYLTFRWQMRVNAEVNDLKRSIEECSSDMDTIALNIRTEILELREILTNAGLETMKVRIDDHDQAVNSIRKDLLDLQIISGTLPTRAGTMARDLENVLEELKAVQSAYLETRAIVDTTKSQVENLAKAYQSLHFTSKELEALRDRLDDAK